MEMSLKDEVSSKRINITERISLGDSKKRILVFKDDDGNNEFHILPDTLRRVANIFCGEEDSIV